LRLPHWSVQRLLAERPELRAGPLLLLQRDSRRGSVVAACCDQARAAGVRIGTPLAEATALLPPTTAVRLYDPAADLAALGRLAADCEQFSPRVGWETIAASEVVRWWGGEKHRSPPHHLTTSPPHHLFLDITGVPVLFGGEYALADCVLAACREREYAGRVAIAETLGAAWAVTSFESSFPGGAWERGFVIIPPGGVLAAMRPLPVESLRLPAETVDVLARLGVGTVADLLRLPRAGLAARFGAALLRRLDQALGTAPEILLPHRPPPVFEAIQELDYPTERREDLDWVLDQLIDRVTAGLQAHGRGAVRIRAEFRCAFYSLRPYGEDSSCLLAPASCPLPPWGEGLGWGVNGSAVDRVTPHPNPPPQGGRGKTKGGRGQEEGRGNAITIEVGLYRPTDLAKPVRELVRLHCDRLSLPGPVDRVRLWADQTIPLRPQQERLFPDPTAVVDVHGSQLIERLSSRLGPAAVLRPVFQADPLPERAVRYVPLINGRPGGRGSCRAEQPGSAGASPSRPTAVSHRPLRVLAPPAPVAVEANRAPTAFRWQGRRHAIARCRGPERIETGWWRGGIVRRDYYRVETAAGRRFWLFRDLVGGGWFLHGSFE
jgi:protein ImuB